MTKRAMKNDELEMALKRIKTLEDRLSTNPEEKFIDESYQDSTKRRCKLYDPLENHSKVIKMLEKIAEEIKKDFPNMYQSHLEFLKTIRGDAYPPQSIICLSFNSIGCSKTWAVHRANDNRLRVHCCGLVKSHITNINH